MRWPSRHRGSTPPPPGHRWSRSPPGACAAALAVVEKDRARTPGSARLQIGVLAHDVGGLPPELQRYFFEVPRGRPKDELPHLGGACEGHRVHVRVRRQPPKPSRRKVSDSQCCWYNYRGQVTLLFACTCRVFNPFRVSAANDVSHAGVTEWSLRSVPPYLCRFSPSSNAGIRRIVRSLRLGYLYPDATPCSRREP